MIATDLDRTLIWEDNVVRARTLAALARAEEEGLRVVVVTGRMVQSARRVLEGVPLADGMVCYQGAVVTDGDGGWIHHQPIEVDLARDAITAIEESGFTLNAYVGDELYVAEATEWAERYAGFQQLHVNAVGRLSTWIAEPPTKLVCVGEPTELDAFAVQMRAQFGERLWISKSFPHFLEFADAGVSKGSGLDHLAGELMRHIHIENSVLFPRFGA